ncbi:MAG: hypothetical protein ACYTAN_06925 [Planctomycetota bacterium]
MTIWHFVDYGARYEPGAALEKLQAVAIPKYLQWHINAWDDAGAGAIKALQALRMQLSAKDYLWHLGAFVELLTIVTNTESIYRGYLLTARKEPASTVDIGRLLGVDGRKARQVLSRFENAAILEQVNWPLPGSHPGDKDDSQSLRLRTWVSSKAAKKRPGQPQKRRKPLKKGERSAAQIKISKGQQTPAKRRPRGPRSAENAPGLQGAKASISTTSTRSDEGGEPKRVGSEAASPSFPRLTGRLGAGSPPEKVGEILQRQRHRYSIEARLFAERILTASGFATTDPHQYANELAHFAKPWETARGEFDPRVLDRIQTKIVRVAEQMRTQRHALDNPQAYLLRALQNEIIDRRRAGQGGSAVG